MLAGSGRDTGMSSYVAGGHSIWMHGCACTAFVEDLRPFYHREGVVAARLTVSAGTNIKVLEATACGKALVTTSTGCRGLSLQDAKTPSFVTTGTDSPAQLCACVMMSA